MKRRQYLLLVALTIVAGLVGGAVSNWVFMARIALAQEDTQADKAVDRPFDLSKYLEGLTPLDKDKKQHEKVITAEEFRLVDKQGRTLAMLCKGPDGAGLLALYNTKTLTPGILLTPGLISLSDSEGFANSIDLQSVAGGSRLALTDHMGKSRVIIMQNPVEGLYLKLYDKDGKERAVLGNVNLETTGTGSVERRPESSLVLFDKEGKVIWRAPH